MLRWLRSHPLTERRREGPQRSIRARRPAYAHMTRPSGGKRRSCTTGTPIIDCCASFAARSRAPRVLLSWRRARADERGRRRPIARRCARRRRRRSSPSSMPRSRRRAWSRWPICSKARPACSSNRAAGSARSRRCRSAARRRTRWPSSSTACRCRAPPPALIDLSTLPVAGLERVEVWRGVPPIEFGAEAVGGAINLVTRRGALVPELRVVVGAGSFGARAASAGWSGSDGGLRIDLSAAYNGATGDFIVLRHRRHAVQPDRRSHQHPPQQRLRSGRRRRHRRRAPLAPRHARLSEAAGRARRRPRRRRVAARAPRHRPRARRRRRRRRIGAWRWRVAAALVYERLGFANPLGDEDGPFGPDVTDAQALSEGLYARAARAVGPPSALARARRPRAEERWPRDLLYPRAVGPAPPSGSSAASASRTSCASSTSGSPLTAGLRLDGDYNRLSVTDDGAAGADERRAADRPRDRAPRRLALAGVARRRRPLRALPDAARALRRRRLRAARTRCSSRRRRGPATSAARSPPTRAACTRSLEATFFGRAVDDTIVYLPSSRAAAAQNIGPTRMLGVELRAAAALGRFFAARVDYAFVDARLLDRRGRADPRPPAEPAHHARRRQAGAVRRLVRARVRRSPLPRSRPTTPGSRRARCTPSAPRSTTSGSSSPSRSATSPTCASCSCPAGATTVPNPLVDYFAYPLPGRAIYATLVFRK